ncbi:MAG TPA: HD domain-containing protein [Candidatus Blautia stercorigallinarum]|uniref:5'-deoxynucleotidase n=1 Tax=Candidatus Blautia stercorigallinarum TaxID=2838501 RepID=A0A9D1TGC0_9FIRM|nr:HD domain-containing protein [Candidatus Blautia stercorigallinarum]
MEKKEERLKKQMDFLLEADKLKFITRQTYLSDGKRKENDGEHSWHLALMAVLLSEYSNEKVDLVKVITMVLIHDIVEIDAGDTYAYDAVGNQSKREREVKAADRIFNILPEDQAKKFRQLWEEFEAYETPEAKFAHVCDNVQPLMLNDATDGLAWREHDVKKSQVLQRNSRTGEGSQVMMEYINKILDKNVESGNLKDE